MLVNNKTFLLSAAAMLVATALSACQSAGDLRVKGTDLNDATVSAVDSRASNYLSVELAAQSYQLISSASQLQLKKGG